MVTESQHLLYSVEQFELFSLFAIKNNEMQAVRQTVGIDGVTATHFINNSSGLAARNQ